MTTNLDELKIPNSVTIKIPEKSYFKKYIYKVEFEATQEKQAHKNRMAQQTKSSGYGFSSYGSWKMSRPDLWAVKREITSKFITLLAEHEEKNNIKFDYRIRQEGYIVSVFFSDPAILGLIFQDKLKSKVTTLYKPVNDNHLAKMEIEKQVRVRKTLFLGEFRYKVYLKPNLMRKINVEDIETWINDTFPETDRAQVNPGLKIAFLNGNNKNGKYSWQYNTTLAVYFKDETDVMVAKLRLHDCISHVEEAVLVSEL